MNKKLTRKFFERPTLKVASNLLGKYLVRDYRGKKIIGEIIEAEAYIGEDDLASHASRGRTARTEVMYGEAGHAYIYLVYGMYYMFNIVTENKNFPAAVLIRALLRSSSFEGQARVSKKISLSAETLVKVDGPGKLSQFMKIDKKINNEDLVTSKKLWVEDPSTPLRVKSIKKSPRVGISYAKHCQKYLWRFSI